MSDITYICAVSYMDIVTIITTLTQMALVNPTIITELVLKKWFVFGPTGPVPPALDIIIP